MSHINVKYINPELMPDEEDYQYALGWNACLDKILSHQKIFDADDPKFKEAFDAALKANNMPDKKQGDGYRSLFVQAVFKLTYEVVNRLKLTLPVELED